MRLDFSAGEFSNVLSLRARCHVIRDSLSFKLSSFLSSPCAYNSFFLYAFSSTGGPTVCIENYNLRKTKLDGISVKFVSAVFIYGEEN